MELVAAKVPALPSARADSGNGVGRTGFGNVEQSALVSASLWRNADSDGNATQSVEQQLGRKLNKAQIMREVKKLMGKFKIGNLPFIHYEGKDDEDGKKK